MSDLKVYLFCSRNKDNKNVKDFKPRRRAFLAYTDDINSFYQFDDFVKHGVPGEMSRMYESINPRDEAKVRKALTAKLVLDDNIQIGKISSIAVSVAAKKGCAADRKWLLDVDTRDRYILQDILSLIPGNVPRRKYITPNGFGIIVARGFDTRTLLAKYKDICDIKKDGMQCVNWDQN